MIKANRATFKVSFQERVSVARGHFCLLFFLTSSSACYRVIAYSYSILTPFTIVNVLIISVVTAVLTDDPVVTYNVRKSQVYKNILCEDRVEYVCNVVPDKETMLWFQWSVGDKVLPGNTLHSTELPAVLTTTEIIDLGVQSYPFVVSRHCILSFEPSITAYFP